MMWSFKLHLLWCISASGESPGDFCRDQKQSQQKSQPLSEEQFCNAIANSFAQKREF